MAQKSCPGILCLDGNYMAVMERIKLPTDLLRIIMNIHGDIEDMKYDWIYECVYIRTLISVCVCVVDGRGSPFITTNKLNSLKFVDMLHY